MGCDVHITRAESWLDAEAAPISAGEWLEYVRSDSEMRLDGQATATTNQGEVVSYQSEGLAVWTAYSQDGLDGNHAWFDHRRGQIVVKNPDEEVLRKMGRIADHFGAHVLGDEDEDCRVVTSPAVPKRNWLARFFGR